MSFTRLYESNEFKNKVLNIIKSNNDFNTIIDENNTYPYYYFLSYLRKNLFLWYPFKENGTLLEIGGGYGQLSSVFTDKLKSVTVIESDDTKKEIISSRLRNYKNFNVVISDFNKIDTNQKYDYIVLCDVFEYVKAFNNVEKPYESYLEYLKSLLTDDGVILIAISNRIGLKYFAGFKEEHTNEIFNGIENFTCNEKIQTFSKGELENIIESAGFSNYKFFYPYPDHRFPEIITTDKYVNKIVYDRSTAYYSERYDFFKEEKLNQVLANEEIAANFSNSFLVEIRNSDKHYLTDDIDFVKLNSDRVKKYRTGTSIINRNNNVMVSKFPLNVEAENHILNMYTNRNEKFGKIKCLNSEMKNYTIYYRFLKEKPLEDYFIDAIKNNDKKEFFKLLELYYDALFYDSFETSEYSDNKKFLSVFKKKSNEVFHCHNKANLDLIFSNIFIVNNELVAIDYEWLLNFPVPLEYIFYRVIVHHRKANPLFREFITLEEVFNYFNLDIKNFDLFNKWDFEFLHGVFGKHLKPIHKRIPKEYIDSIDMLNDYKNLVINDKNINENLRENLIFNQLKVINSQERIIKNQKEYINLIEHSSSWKITKPLRKLMKILKGN